MLSLGLGAVAWSRATTAEQERVLGTYFSLASLCDPSASDDQIAEQGSLYGVAPMRSSVGVVVNIWARDL